VPPGPLRQVFGAHCCYPLIRVARRPPQAVANRAVICQGGLPPPHPRARHSLARQQVLTPASPASQCLASKCSNCVPANATVRYFLVKTGRQPAKGPANGQTPGARIRPGNQPAGNQPPAKSTPANQARETDRGNQAPPNERPGCETPRRSPQPNNRPEVNRPEPADAEPARAETIGRKIIGRSQNRPAAQSAAAESTCSKQTVPENNSPGQ